MEMGEDFLIKMRKKEMRFSDEAALHPKYGSFHEKKKGDCYFPKVLLILSG